jgi:autotransporter-associated beta strand protein
VIDNGNNTYDFAQSGTSGVNNITAAPTGGGGTGNAGNVKYTSGTTSFNVNGSWVTINLQGASTVLNINGTQIYLDEGGIILSGGATLGGGKPVKSNAGKFYVYVPDSGTINASLQAKTTEPLYKMGPGNLTLNSTAGNNNYTGGTVVNQGTLTLGAGGGSGEIKNTLTIYPGATVKLTAQDALGYNSGAVVTPVNIVGGTLDNAINNNNGWITTFNLTGGVMTNSVAITGTAGYLFNGSSAALNSLATNIPSISYTPMVLKANGLVVTVAQGTVPSGIDLSFTGGMVGSGGTSFTKAGAGTLELAGTGSTLTGGTITVSAGTLLVDSATGAGSDAVTASGAGTTVGGSGTIGGLVSLGSTTVLSPGTNSTTGQTLTCSGGITCSGATNIFDLSTSASGANDKVAVTGTLTIGSADTIKINPITASTLDTADYTLFTATSVAGSGTPTLAWGTSTPANPGYYSIVKNATNVVLHYQAPGSPPTVGPVAFSPVSPVYTGTVVTASATVVNTGTGLTYQWQGSSDDSTWATAAGASTSATYLPGTSAAGTNYYRLIATDSYGAATNAGAALAVIIAPTVNTASAVPSSLGHYQTTTITVNVTPASGQSITSVTVGVDGLGGAGDPVTLTGPGGNGAGNWTGTFTVPGTLAAGSYTVSGVVNQNNGGSAAWSVSGITVTNANEVWNGLGSDNKWSTGANWVSGVQPGAGDNATLAGTTQVTNNLDSNLSMPPTR